jgi:hypothetical protein
MTNNEQKTIDQLLKTVSDIKTENRLLVDKLTKTIEEINTKVNQKHVPITLEQDILSTAQISIQKAIQESLTKYDSPLVKLVTNVINENSTELKKIISDSFNDVIKLEEFKDAIRTGFSHKIARTIISNNDGLFDKVSNELKQDAVFKSKMSLAVANVVNECLENRK